MPVIGCLEIFQNGRSPQPITGIIYSPGPHELKIGSAVEDTLGFIPLVSCLHFGKIHKTKSTQPPLLRLHFVNPPSPLSVDVI